MVALEISSFPNLLSRIGFQGRRSMGAEMDEYPASVDYGSRGGIAVHGVTELGGLVFKNHTLRGCLPVSQSN